ncbi:uncharacterized membrane protein At4g09580-like [Hibiscus syriacus]|uniref:uncharacterized membrane protein At4g09580-like n=1 Tax=Hibiscus syriacus TaxID=106335 RepID=UPI0019239CB6|nr:uncharacterized membrane protein At4g09580-like [Hibiscus syriacus]
MSLLSRVLFGVLKGVALVVFTATADACFFLSELVGNLLVISLWLDKLSFSRAQVVQRRASLLNYMLFLRLTPTSSNIFINVVSPIVDVLYRIFFTETFIRLILIVYITIRTLITLEELQSSNSNTINDIYDINLTATLFLIGIVSVTPTLMRKTKS